MYSIDVTHKVVTGTNGREYLEDMKRWLGEQDPSHAQILRVYQTFEPGTPDRIWVEGESNQIYDDETSELYGTFITEKRIVANTWAFISSRQKEVHAWSTTINPYKWRVDFVDAMLAIQFKFIFA
jgi:hypothetical protein